jgi:hypothetical protein
MPGPAGFFGGFQLGEFQSNFQTTLIINDPGPSQIVFMPSPTLGQVPELSDYYATISYLDIYGDPYTPISVQWRVWDDTNKVQLQDWTAIAQPGESNLIDLSSAVNALTNAKSLVETRKVVFWIVASGGAQRYDTGVYYVNAVPDVP